MKTVLLAGATGFVGRRIASGLRRRNVEVVAITRADSDLSVLPQGCSVLVLGTGPLSIDAWRAATPAGVDAFINAAVTYGRNTSPEDAVQHCNVELPAQWLAACLALDCPRFVQLDSFFSKPGMEHDYLPGYTQSKRECLRRARATVAGTGITYFNVRLEHVYGPGDHPAKFVPWLVEALRRGQERIALTFGRQQRDFVHVDDVASGLTALITSDARHPGSVQEVSLGSGSAISVREFATRARAIAGSDSKLDFGAIAETAREIASSCADLRYLAALGWSPSVDLDTGLRTLLDPKRGQEP
jgi:nucleoside-diphosphate-sugar epimerase